MKRSAGGLLAALAAAAILASAFVPVARAGVPGDVAFEQRLGAAIPGELEFADASGDPIRLGDLLGRRPVFLVLAYYRCRNLCGLLLEALARSLARSDLPAGEAYDVIVISIDPDEDAAAARDARSRTLAAYDRPDGGDGWHFLTGSRAAIARIAGIAGFRYAFDPRTDQYAHPAGISLLTEDGRIARYFLGLEFSPRDLRFGLMETSNGRIGSLADRVRLLCYAFDPATGRYTPVVTGALRIAGAGTVLALAGLVLFLLRRERVRHRRGRRGVEANAHSAGADHR